MSGLNNVDFMSLLTQQERANNAMEKVLHNPNIPAVDGSVFKAMADVHAATAKMLQYTYDNGVRFDPNTEHTSPSLRGSQKPKA